MMSPIELSTEERDALERAVLRKLSPHARSLDYLLDKWRGFTISLMAPRARDESNYLNDAYSRQILQDAIEKVPSLADRLTAAMREDDERFMAYTVEAPGSIGRNAPESAWWFRRLPKDMSREQQEHWIELLVP